MGNTELPSTESSSEISDLTKEMSELIRSAISDQRTRQSIEEPPQTPVSPVAMPSILGKNKGNNKDGGGLVVTIKEKGTVGLAFLPQVAPPTIKRFANEAMVPFFLA